MEFFALKGIKKEFQARTFRKRSELIFYLFFVIVAHVIYFQINSTTHGQ